MIIYGAGMAGLLAGNMLRRFDPKILEAQSSLPNNHSALLRFRTGEVGNLTGIPFEKVRVLKAIGRICGKLDNIVTLRDNNEYSFKVAGEIINRSILSLDPVDRYIAPHNLISQLAQQCDIYYDEPMAHPVECISTIPMPRLMDIVGWKDRPEFKYKPIVTVNATLSSPHVDVYQTIYFPDERLPYYRASLTGNLLTVEYPGHVEPHECDWERLLNYFGVWACSMGNVTVKRQEYGKLLPIDEALRKQFILAMTDQYRIYSVGRFATWRQILMDDVVQDLRRIDIWISERNNYSRHLHHNARTA
jgi:hypothetical protein